MKTSFAPSLRRPSLLLAAAAAVLAGCGGHGTKADTSTGPSIKSQPTSQTAVLGGSVTFSVTASTSGTTTYQWYKNGGTLTGATSSSITIDNITQQSQATYYVTITDENGTTTSKPVTLTLTTTALPVIASQPTSLAVAPGGTAKFTVVARGAGTLTYQWFKDGTAVTGATESTYTISPVANSDAGSYYVVITNASGSTTSDTVTLATSASAPTITSQPVSQTITQGAKVTFTVTATSLGTTTYQWYKGTTAISGATSASYSINSVSAGDAGSYSVVVTNSFGSTASNSASLTVISTPVITQQPTGGTVNESGNLTLTVQATGVNLQYQWYRNGSAISGATGSSYTIVSATGNSGGSYYVIVKNTAGQVASNTVTVTVSLKPVITTQPVAQTVGEGSTATFTVGATGSNLTFQWYKNGAAISGATSTSYTTPAVATTDSGAAYYCIVSNTAGTAQSNTVALTVVAKPTITTQPTSATVTAPATATFTVVATVPTGGTLSYEWYRVGSTTVLGTAASYTTPATDSSYNGAQYYCRVYNKALSYVDSNTVTLTVN